MFPLRMEPNEDYVQIPLPSRRELQAKPGRLPTLPTFIYLGKINVVRSLTTKPQLPHHSLEKKKKLLIEPNPMFGLDIDSTHHL